MQTGLFQAAGIQAPLWEVLYHEAMSGNYLLFTPQEVERFETDLGPSDFLYAYDESDQLTDICFRIFHAASLRDMLELISEQGEEAQRRIYVIYRQFLAQLRQKLHAKIH